MCENRYRGVLNLIVRKGKNMKLRFYNAKILTMENENIIDGELRTDGARISYVGAAKADEEGFDREIDLNGNLIIPGFKDAHTTPP